MQTPLLTVVPGWRSAARPGAARPRGREAPSLGQEVGARLHAKGGQAEGPLAGGASTAGEGGARAPVERRQAGARGVDVDRVVVGGV